MKSIKNSRLIIGKIVRTDYDENGNIIQEIIKEEVSEEPVNLGSVKKPNKNIKFWKYEIPEDKPKHPFGFTFGYGE